MMDFQFRLTATKLVLGCCLTVSTLAPASAAITPLWYSTSVDSTSSTATFFVKFDRRPDLLTVDEHARQADEFQFWLDSEAPNPIGRAYGGLNGDLPADTQTVISAGQIPTLNQMEIIWVKPSSWPGPWSRGGWGSIEGHVSYSLTPENVVSFSVPLSLLRDTDGSFYYTFETFSYGGWGGYSYSGVSGQYYSLAVPEPSTAVLFLVGLGLMLGYRPLHIGSGQLRT